jgi:hypothetical protein
VGFYYLFIRLIRLISTEESPPLSRVPHPTSYNSGLNVSKATVDSAELAGKSKFSETEVSESGKFIAKIVASSNQSAASDLINASSKARKWQSAGNTGSHFLEIELKPGFVASTVGLVVDTTDESYCPEVITVAVGKNKESLSKCPIQPVQHNFSISGTRGRKFMFALLDNEDPSVRFVRIGVQRCLSNGQDTVIRGIIVRGSDPEAKVVHHDSDAPTNNSFRSLDAPFILMQSISEGILYDLQHEGLCEFSDCNENKDIFGKLSRIFNRSLQLSSKYFGPVSLQENEQNRKVRFMCCRNAILRLVPDALIHHLREKCDIRSCLAGLTTDLCLSTLRAPSADSSDNCCVDFFQSLILFADNIAHVVALEEIHSTILQAVEHFISGNLLHAAVLQHSLHTCSMSMWGQSPAAVVGSSSYSAPTSATLVPWRGKETRYTVSKDSSSVKFHDFSTLRGPAFNRHGHHGYYEIVVTKSCHFPQFGFFTNSFECSLTETGKGCGDDSHSWYSFNPKPLRHPRR